MSDEPLVYIKDAQGNILQGPASELAAAKRAGASEISPEDVQEDQLQNKYGGVGGMAAGAGVGALDALTLGFGSGALGELGGDDFKEDIRGVQAANPWSTGIGTAVGAIAPAILTGGGSLAEEGGLSLMGRLARSPTALLEGAGDAAASSLGESTLGRIGGGVVRGAIQGGAYGAGSQVSEDALGDTDTTAEKLIAAIGHGALIGGATGGAFELPGGAVRGLLGATRSRAADIDAVAEKEFGHAAPGVGAAVKAFARLSERVSDADAGDIEALGADAFGQGNGREMRKLLHDEGVAYQDEAARTIRETADEMLSANKLVNAEARGDLKASYVARAVQRGNEGETTGWALKQVDGLIDGAQETLDAGGGYTKAIEHASTAAYRAKGVIEDAVKEGGPDVNAKTFVALDNMKRDLQKLTRNSYQSLGHMSDPIDQRAARVTTEWLDKGANGFRDGLEDEKLWGKAAVDQREINASWSKQIDAEKRFHAALTTDVGRDPSNPYLQMRGVDPGKASSYVRNIVNPDKDLTHKAVIDYIDSTKALSGSIQKAYELPAQTVGEVSRLNRAAGKFSDTIQKAQESLTFINQYKALKARAGSGALGTIGAVVGGPVGAAVGVAADMLGNPAKQIDRLAALERLQDRVNQKLGRVADAMESTSRKVERPHALDVTPGRKSFEASAERIRELAANPEARHSSISDAIEPIATAAPKIAAAVAMRSHAMVVFLAQHLPPGMSPTDGALNTKWSKPLYTDGEMGDWQHLAAALHDPITTLEQGVKSGTLTPKEVGAIKQFYPKLFGEVVADMEQRIAEMKDPPPREKRLVLSTLFGIPTDVDLTPGVGAALATLYNTPEAPQGTPGGSGREKQMSVETQNETPGQLAESGEKS
jgi:hypothetical protein